MFDGSGITFDMESGKFIHSIDSRGDVALYGDSEEAVAWTRHLLQRIGFTVRAGEQPITILVQSGEKHQWEIVREGIAVKVDSLYDMARFLTRK
jgi:hypothetical protein